MNDPQFNIINNKGMALYSVISVYPVMFPDIQGPL